MSHHVPAQLVWDGLSVVGFLTIVAAAAGVGYLVISRSDTRVAVTLRTPPEGKR